MAVLVVGQGVEDFGPGFHVEFVGHLNGTITIQIVLPTVLVERQVLVKSLAQESLPHSL